MKKSWILLAGAAVGLSSCVVTGNVEIFSAFNLRAPKVACTFNTTTNSKELNLAFTYAGTLRGVNLTFASKDAPTQKASITDLANPPVGLRIDTLTAGDAKLYINLEKIAASPVTPLGIPRPQPVTSYPMDVQVEAIGNAAAAKITLSPLTNVDVKNCYPPDPTPVNP